MRELVQGLDETNDVGIGVGNGLCRRQSRVCQNWQGQGPDDPLRDLWCIHFAVHLKPTTIDFCVVNAATIDKDFGNMVPRVENRTGTDHDISVFTRL